jgi:ParB family chromosome partitioning protein
MSLKGKAAKVDLGDLDSDAPPAGAPVQQAPARARSGVAAITQSIAVHHRVQELEEKLATYEDAKLVVRLDPKRVRQSKWKNRHELSFSTQKYADLKAEIESAGGNVQPIKVRRVGHGTDGQDEYEIVFGRRRLRACLELGLMVNAVVEEMDEVQLFTEMERENRNREDLTPWEQGVMYKDALDAGLFTSQRQMAGKLGVNQALISTAVKLASLPEEVIGAFPSPLDLQFRWAQELTEALEKDAVRVMAEAAEVIKLAARPSAKEVLQRLLAATKAGKSEPPGTREFKVDGKVVGSVIRDRRGAIAFKVRAGVLQPAGEKKLIDFLEKLLGG